MRLFLSNKNEVPLDRELEVRVGWFIRLRWLAGVGVWLGATGVWLTGLERSVVVPLYVVGGILLGYNALLTGLHRRLASQEQFQAARWRLFAHLQVALDWIALAVLSGFTGGLESPLILFFTFHVLLAAMLLPRRECLIQTSVALLLIVGMAHFCNPAVRGSPDLTGTLPTSPLAVVQVYGDGRRVTAYVLMLAGLLYTCTFLASSITERLRQREKELLDSRNREEQMHAEMALLHELAKSITATLDLNLVLQRAAERAAHTLSAKACSIRLLSESGELHISAAYGLSEAYLQKGPVDLAHSPIDRRALLGEPVLVHDLTRESLFQYPEEAVREGIRSVLCVPLLAQDRAFGVMRVYSEVPGGFGQEDVQFLQHFASLAAIAISNARTYQVLQNVDRERSRFMRTVAHELRSPLAAILSNLDVVLEGYVGSVSEKATQLLARTRQRASLLLALTTDLLALAAGREAPAERARERLSLAEIARQTVHDLEGQAQSKSVQLGLHIHQGPLDLWGNRDQLERLMDNLVGNAVKYTLEGGRVTVRLNGDERSVELVVEDTGIGIPRAAQDRLFEEFFRAENAKRLTEQGTGLGLSIVKRIVEDHRGKIAVESEEGQGTRITVILPRNGQRSAASDPSPIEARS